MDMKALGRCSAIPCTGIPQWYRNKKGIERQARLEAEVQRLQARIAELEAEPGPGLIESSENLRVDRNYWRQRAEKAEASIPHFTVRKFTPEEAYEKFSKMRERAFRGERRIAELERELERHAQGPAAWQERALEAEACLRRCRQDAQSESDYAEGLKRQVADEKAKVEKLVKDLRSFERKFDRVWSALDPEKDYEADDITLVELAKTRMRQRSPSGTLEQIITRAGELRRAPRAECWEFLEAIAGLQTSTV